MTSTRTSSDAVRERILGAAGARFREFGYGKTTMAEIAQDCAMSAANLYRYFESKRAIAAVLACDCLSSKEALLKDIAVRAGPSAADKVREMVLEGLRYTYRQWRSAPRLSELVDDISRSRQDIVARHLGQRHIYFVQVIEQGNASREFAVADPPAAADAILAATFLFDFPNVMSLFAFDDFERKARAVCDLLITGLRRC